MTEAVAITTTNAQRIAGLEVIQTIPVLFFTLAHHEKSAQVLKALSERLPSDEVRCITFLDENEAENYLRAKRIESWHAVRLEDAFRGRRGRGYFSHQYRSWTEPMPWNPRAVPFVVNIHQVEAPCALRCIVNQIASNFRTKFFDRINDGQLPWGASAKARTVVKGYRRPQNRRILCFGAW